VSSVTKSCGRTRRLLWPGAGPRAASPEVIEAQQHLEVCTACQRFLRDMLALGDAIHDAAAREHAPPDVRERLFSAIARARTGAQSPPRQHRRAQWFTAAGVLLVGLVGPLTVNRLLRDTRTDPITAIAEDHAKSLGETHIASKDPAEITRWLAGQVHFAVRVPVLPGAELRGGRLCVLDGRRCAVMEYDVDGVAVSYFVVPDGTEPAGRGAPPRFDGTKRAGYHVVAWREPGLLHAMVGNLPESRLATLAKACVDQARRVAWLREQWIAMRDSEENT
jgi:anti-sigma factor RsiW